MTNLQAVSTFVPPSVETLLGSVSAVTQTKRSSSDQEQRSDMREGLEDNTSETHIGSSESERNCGSFKV